MTIKRYKAVIKIPNPIWKEIYLEADTMADARLALKAEFNGSCSWPDTAGIMDESGDLYIDPREGFTEEGYQTHKAQIIEIKQTN